MSIHKNITFAGTNFDLAALYQECINTQSSDLWAKSSSPPFFVNKALSEQQQPFVYVLSMALLCYKWQR